MSYAQAVRGTNEDDDDHDFILVQNPRKCSRTTMSPETKTNTPPGTTQEQTYVPLPVITDNINRTEP